MSLASFCVFRRLLGFWTDRSRRDSMRLHCSLQARVRASSMEIRVENQSDEVDGLGSVSVWSGGMDIKEIG